MRVLERWNETLGGESMPGAAWWRAIRLPDVGDPDRRRPAPVDGRGRRALLARPVLLGLLATTAIAVGASLPSSPFSLKSVPGAWFFGIPGQDAHQGQFSLFLALVSVYGGMLLLFRVWYDLARILSDRSGIPVKTMALIFALWIIPLLVAPPIFSRDVYSYAAQGDMVSHHISPYQYGPAVLGAGPYVAPVDPLWGNAPAPYGPLFLGAAGAVTDVTAHHELATVIGLRLLALLGVVLVAIYIPRLARHYGRDPAQAFLLAVLNPVTLLHLIGGAHNDALMIGLLVMGITLAKERRPVLGVVCCALAAAVKVPAAIGIVYVGWEWAGTGVPWRQRVRPLITAAIIATAVMAVLSRATGLGWGWLFDLGTPDTVRSMLAPMTALGVLSGHAVNAVGIGLNPNTILSLARAVGLLAAAGIAAFLLLRSERVGTTRAIGTTLLLFVVLGPVDQPWYLVWGLIMLAPLVTGRGRMLLIGLSIASSLVGMPGGRQFLGELGSASLAWVVLGIVLVVLIPFTPVPRWARGLLARRQRGALTEV